MSLSKSLLLVVDVQNGFVTNAPTRQIVPKINSLTTAWQKHGWPVVFSKFINAPDSQWVRWMEWKELMGPPETNLHSELRCDYGKVYEKTQYSAWSPEILQMAQSTDAQSVVVCGIDTDQCVLATVLDIFDADLKPVVIKDCCASSAEEPYFHEAGLKLLERLIGSEQIVTMEELI